MNQLYRTLDSWQPYALSIFRIAAGLLFMTFGTMKLFGWPNAMPPGHEAVFLSQIWWAGMLECFGGLLIALGLFTRPVAFLLSGLMAFAYFIGHAPHGFWPTVNQGTPAIIYCWLWFYYVFAGAGPWSLDALLGRKVAEPEESRF
jgi:putative oxidoreductase